MIRWALGLLFLIPTLLFSTDYAYFTPPKDWLIADPSTYAPCVTICFVHKKKKGIPPSINLAIEENVSSLEEYAQAVRAIHERDKNNRWRKLTTLQTAGSVALLTEVDTTSGGQPMRLLQLLIVHNDTAYTITAAAKKEEMSKYYDAFLKAFKSFTITQNLLESIPESKRSDALLARVRELKTKSMEPSFKKKWWNPFEKQFLKEFADLGAHWQILALGELQKEVFDNDKKTTH